RRIDLRFRGEWTEHMAHVVFHICLHSLSQAESGVRDRFADTVIEAPRQAAKNRVGKRKGDEVPAGVPVDLSAGTRSCRLWWSLPDRPESKPLVGKASNEALQRCCDRLGKTGNVGVFIS